MAATFFTWQNSYSVSVAEIDNQHKAIIEMLNELYEAFLKKEHGQMTGEIITRLSDYAVYHFQTEEEYFEMFKYSKRISHIKEHKDFTETVSAFQKEYEKNNFALTYKIINFLREWLVNHILVSDKEYSKCFVENGLH